MGVSGFTKYTLILGLMIVLAVFVFEIMNGNRLENPIEMTKRIQSSYETTTQWTGSPIAKETSVTKNKTSFSAVPSQEERGS